MASALPYDNSDKVLGTRLINAANEWELEENNFPTLENVQQYLKGYQSSQKLSNPSYVNGLLIINRQYYI